jgi:S-sulfo-L-cysteine synthase (3-phospho-L-serine-dependent)
LPVPPGGARRFDSPLDLIRESSVVRIPPREASRAGAQLWAQLELGLPGGMKDRVALHMIEDAEARGELHPGDVIVESSSGTMAEGLARVAAVKGYRLIIVSDPRLDEMTRAKLQALGAELEIVETYDPVGGWQRPRLERLRQVMERWPRACWVKQYESPSNPAAYADVARAMVESLGPNIAALVGTVGSGGSLCGTARCLRRLLPRLKVVAVDAVGSVLFHQPNRTRLQGGHGNSVVPGNLDYRAIDEVHWVADGEAFGACRELARRTGIFAGGSSGAAYLVASWVAAQSGEEDHVVAIFPDRGDRYHGTIYSREFLAERGLADAVAGPEPQRIRYGVDVAESWSHADLPHGQAPYHAADVRTTREIAEELGLLPVEAR